MLDEGVHATSGLVAKRLDEREACQVPRRVAGCRPGVHAPGSEDRHPLAARRRNAKLMDRIDEKRARAFEQESALAQIHNRHGLCIVFDLSLDVATGGDATMLTTIGVGLVRWGAHKCVG